MDSFSICSISLHKSDLLRFHNLPPQLYLGLRETVQLSWPLGIQEERDCYSSKELKLKGQPWSETWKPVQGINLALRILEFMATSGWTLLTPTSVGNKFSTKDTWIFRFDGQPAGAERSMKLSAVSFHGSDRIRVVNGLTSLESIVQATVERSWSMGLQDSKVKDGALHLKMRGYPWNSHGRQNDDLHRFVIALMTSLNAHGFNLLASVRLTHTALQETAEELLPLDTWILKSPSSTS